MPIHLFQKSIVSCLCAGLSALALVAPFQAQSVHAQVVETSPGQTSPGQTLPAVFDGYPADPPNDIELEQNVLAWADMVAAFNTARLRENEMLDIAMPPIVFPDAETWEAMSDGERTLWLINEERVARGLAPMQGLEANVMDVAQSYAEWLLANNQFDHDADGRSPWERLADNAAIGACHDFLGIAENIYFVATTAPTPIPYVVETAVYRMMYEDAGSRWGHRHAMLWTPYVENNGDAGSEGFLGLGRAHGGYTSPNSGQYFQNTDILVMNFFDPCATWEESATATPVPSESPTPSPQPSATPIPGKSPTPSPLPSPTLSPTVEPVQRTISGRVTLTVNVGTASVSSGGLAGVIVAAGGQRAITDASGQFRLENLPAQSHVLTPSKAGYRFSPESIEIDLSTGDFTDVHFSGSGGPSGTVANFSLHLPLIMPEP
jgi:hypothetical protein